MTGGRRRLVWGGVVLALALAVGLLFLAKSAQEGRRGAGPQEAGASADAAPPLRFQVEGPDGAPVAEARAFVAPTPEGALEAAPGWDAAAGTLALEPGRWARLVVQARGYRSVVLERDALQGLAAAGDGADAPARTLLLRPGLVVRILVGGDPVLPGLPYRLYFRLHPDSESWELSPAQREVLVDLMKARRPPPEGVETATRRREDFGLEVAREQAEAGVHVPLPGRYAIRWGLLDVESARWYARRDSPVTVVEVGEDPQPLVVEIPITTDAVEATRRELEAFPR